MLDVLSGEKLELTLRRLACELIENYSDLSEVCFVGLQPRGVYLSRRLCDILRAETATTDFKYGELDVTFFRDDFRKRGGVPLTPSSTRVDFSIENKTVVLIDDVLYTGRTIRASLDALLAFGRPKSVELLVLVDRVRRRELPVFANYVGVKVETLESEKVLVRWRENSDAEGVTIAAATTNLA